MTSLDQGAAREPYGVSRFRDDAIAGLRASPRTLPPKYFYDETGAELFERICDQPEYYLTRAELEILRQATPEIADCVGPGAALVEYGSGAGVKVRLLLDAFDRPASYTPVDISHAQLARVAASLGRAYPDVAVRPLCGDYTSRLDLPRLPASARRRVAFFPGSTIGNFHPAQAIAFLQRVRHTVGKDGALLLGLDRRKSDTVLNAAYNDAAGITAAFNLNLLARMNRELDATFDLSAFAHRAFFNRDASRIEMHLESLRTQAVTVAGETFEFERGETIWTESSYKYDLDGLRAVAGSAGFSLVKLWTDSAQRFWVAYLSA